MSEHHKHQHVVMAIGSGTNFDQAILNAVAGMTDPKGHHSGLTFDAFEVVKIKGTISHKPGDQGTPAHIEVTLQAVGAHQV
jgi:hypothetical protein